MYHEDDREGKPWWSHGAVRKDIWADLVVPASDKHQDASTKERLLALVAGIAVVWRDARALGCSTQWPVSGSTEAPHATGHEIGGELRDKELCNRLQRCVLTPADGLLGDKRHTLTLGLGSPGTQSCAFRSEVFLATQCMSVWSALAQSCTAAEAVADVGTATNDNASAPVQANAVLLHRLCTALVDARWPLWAASRASQPANSTFASTPFAVAVAHAFGYQPGLAANDTETAAVLKQVHTIFPALLPRATSRAIASTQAVIAEVDRCAQESEAAAMVAAVQHLHPLLAQFVDSMQHDAVLLFDACPDPAAAASALGLLVEALVGLICALSKLPNGSAQAAVKDVCGFVQRLQGLIAACPSTAATSLSAGPSNVAAVLGGLYTSAILTDGAVPPTQRTLKQQLMQQPYPDKATEDKATLKARTGAMEALVLSNHVSAAQTAVLTSFLEASPVLFFHSVFETVTKPVHAVHRLDVEPMLSVKDEEGKAFLLDIQRRTQDAHGKLVVVNLEGFMAFYFSRQWKAYTAVESFVSDVVLLKAASDAQRAWSLHVLVAAAELALECHAQQSGAPVAVDHLGCMWLLRTMAVQGVTCAPPNAPMWTVPSKFPLFDPIAASMFPPPPTLHRSAVVEDESSAASTQCGAATDAPHDAVGLPSLAALHKMVVVLGATNLFGFFLPAFRALGVEYSAIRDDAEAFTSLAPDSAQLHIAALGMPRRAMMSFLQFDQLSAVGGSFLSPAMAPFTHAMHFLARIGVGQTSAEGLGARRLFAEIVAEAALLVAMYGAKVDSVTQRVSLVDIDSASALLFAVLRFARANIGEAEIDNIVPRAARMALVGEICDRLRDVALPTNLNADRKKLIRAYLSECMAMATPFEFPVEEEAVAATELTAAAVPKSTVLAEPSAADATNVAVQQGGTVTATTVDEGAPLTDSNVDGQSPEGGTTPIDEAKPEPAAPTAVPEEESAPTVAVVTQGSTTPNPVAAPNLPPSPQRPPPNAHHNVWVSWFWSLRYTDVARPERMAEAHKLLLRSLAAVKGVPTVAIQRLRAFVRDEEPCLKGLTDAARAAHHRVLHALLAPPTVLATQLPVMRALVLQMMKELLLRASISIPDAMISVAVLEQLLQHLAANVSTGPSTTVTDTAAASSVRLPPLLVADALRLLIQGSNAHLCHACKTGTRGLAYFLGELVTKVLLPMRRAGASTTTDKGAKPEGPVVAYGALIPRAQETSLLQDAFMETARTLERVLQASSPRGDVTACLVKSQMLPWLGLYDRVAKRIKECEAERLDAFEDGSPPSGHPLRQLQKLVWVFPSDQSQPVADVRFLFAPLNNSGGAQTKFSKQNNQPRLEERHVDRSKRSRDGDRAERERSASRQRERSKERKRGRVERSGKRR